MDDLSQIIQTVVVIAIAGFFIVYFSADVLYRGRKKQITVVNKRTADYGGFNSNRSKWTKVQHYTVDCRYSGSSKIHTLRCSSSMFDSLKLNKSYTVTVKMSEIIRLYKN